jgi:hypothetical protein
MKQLEESVNSLAYDPTEDNLRSLEQLASEALSNADDIKVGDIPQGGVCKGNKVGISKKLLTNVSEIQAWQVKIQIHSPHLSPVLEEGR